MMLNLEDRFEYNQGLENENSTGEQVSHQLIELSDDESEQESLAENPGNNPGEEMTEEVVEESAIELSGDSDSSSGTSL